MNMGERIELMDRDTAQSLKKRLETMDWDAVKKEVYSKNKQLQKLSAEIEYLEGAIAIFEGRGIASNK